MMKDQSSASDEPGSKSGRSEKCMGEDYPPEIGITIVNYAPYHAHEQSDANQERRIVNDMQKTKRKR